jgi:uncharacterized membrane protein YfcA
MWSFENVAIISFTFIFAGYVKGIIGLGLPSVSLALLTATLGLKDAMTIMLIPTFCTNILQGVIGGNFIFIIKRFSTLIITAATGTWFATGILARSDAILLSGLLGLSICSYASISLFTPQIPAPDKHEKWLSPIIGVISGLLTGLTGSFIMPGVIYLQATRMPRDMLIQAMGVIFSVATLSLAVSLGGHNLLPKETIIISTFALIPALTGMRLGQITRKMIPEKKFRLVFFIGLLLLGSYIITKVFLYKDTHILNINAFF